MADVKEAPPKELKAATLSTFQRKMVTIITNAEDAVSFIHCPRRCGKTTAIAAAVAEMMHSGVGGNIIVGTATERVKAALLAEVALQSIELGAFTKGAPVASISVLTFTELTANPQHLDKCNLLIIDEMKWCHTTLWNEHIVPRSAVMRIKALHTAALNPELVCELKNVTVYQHPLTIQICSACKHSSELVKHCEGCNGKRCPDALCHDCVSEPDKEREREARRAMDELAEYYNKITKQIPGHPPTAECKESGCLVCGTRDCPSGEALHYDKDGCPACALKDHGPHRVAQVREKMATLGH